jgi:hypothetical protein
MSGEPDFAGLRADVEAATLLPEFDRVARRARRIRRRDVGRRLVVSLVMLGALLPAGIVGINAAPGGGTQIQGEDIPIGPDQPDAPSPTSSTAPVITIRAIAGTRIGSLYAAVDVCRPADASTLCSLQVVPLGATAQDQRGPIAVDELRERPADSLVEVTLTSLTPQSLLLSGIRSDGQRKFRRIDLRSGGAEIAPEPGLTTEPQAGDHVVQLRRYGPLSFVRRSDNRVFPTPTQPELGDVTLITSITAEDGWWVTGIDPLTRNVAVGVSRDQGRSWQVSTLDIQSGLSDPVLATGDSTTVFVFVSAASGIQQRRSVDGGHTWTALTTDMPWPAFASRNELVTRTLGAVVRGDGSLLVWIEAAPGAVFLESTDAGGSYHSVTGPSGPIVAVADGFAALGDPPLVSYDGHTWSALPGPAVVVPPG